MKRIKVVAFDAWGTLFDECVDSLLVTSAKIVNDLQLSMSSQKFLDLWTKFYYEERSAFFNIRERNIITLNKVFSNLNVEGDVEKYVSYLIDTRWANSPTYPEVSEVLQSIKLPKCIISDVDNDTVRGALDINGLSFELVVTSETVRAYKPSPKIFLDTLNLLGCSNREVLYVGDSQRHDIVGAKGVGIPVVWVNRRKEKLEDGVPKPDYEIEDLSGLLEILDELQ